MMRSNGERAESLVRRQKNDGKRGGRADDFVRVAQRGNGAARRFRRSAIAKLEKRAAFLFRIAGANLFGQIFESLRRNVSRQGAKDAKKDNQTE